MLREAMPRAGHMDEAFLRWQYVDNPAGPARGLEAFDGDTLVSHCVVQPLEASLAGTPASGVLSLNAATRPQYLGRGIYFGLAREVYASARADGIRFGVAVTNDQSTPGFQRHCGFSLVGPLEARVGLGPTPSPPQEDPEAGFRKVWDERSLAWRLAPPHARYRRHRRKSGDVILGPSGLPGVEVELGRIPRTQASPLLPEEGRPRRSFRLWVGMDRRLRWGRSLYWNLPMRVRPSPLNLIFVDLQQPGTVVDPAKVRWQALDFDDF